MIHQGYMYTGFPYFKAHYGSKASVCQCFHCTCAYQKEDPYVDRVGIFTANVDYRNGLIGMDLKALSLVGNYKGSRICKQKHMA